jgi:acyl-CoA synthetase (AMP-forming)/AMP-acid ligase II
MTQGAFMVFPSEYFDPGKTLAAIEQEQCTALHGVPTMFSAELGHPDFTSSISAHCGPESWRELPVRWR